MRSRFRRADFERFACLCYLPVMIRITGPQSTALLLATTLAVMPLAAPLAAAAEKVAQSKKVIECYCTDRFGKRRELGEIICLTVGGRSFEAKCVMAQNNPFWRDLERGCLNARNASSVDHA